MHHRHTGGLTMKLTTNKSKSEINNNQTITKYINYTKRIIKEDKCQQKKLGMLNEQ